MKKILYWFAILLSTSALHANTVEANLNSWFLSWNRVNINKSWSFTNEINERTGKFLREQGIFFVRPSIDYHWGEEVELSQGYTYMVVEPYSPYNQPLTFVEEQVWQQVLLKFKWQEISFFHRFRQEERFIPHVANDQGVYFVDYRFTGYRFRYRITMVIDAWKSAVDQSSIFIAVYDESFWLQNNHLGFTDFERNRLYLGAGYRFDPDTNVQLGFMNQYQRITPDLYISSPIVLFTFSKVFNL